MPSTQSTDGLLARATSQRNATIYAAILLSLPAAYAFQSVFGADAGAFLLLLTLAVSVPDAYDRYWQTYPRTWQGVAWVAGASAIAAAEFVGLYWVGTESLSLDPLWGSVFAFVLVQGANLAWLVLWRQD